MDWKKKYNELTSGFYKCCDDISEQYPECDDFEKCVISLRLKGWTYGNIQKKLGMPPKKEISRVLNKWAPETVDNSKKKESKLSKWESELYNIVNKHNPLEVEFEEEPYLFYIQNNTLRYKEEDGAITAFRDINEIMQQQFLIAIKEQENE